MAISKYHQEHPEEYKKYCKERCKKYRWEHPEKIREIIKNRKDYDSRYREEHREEKRESERTKNQASMKRATNAKSRWTPDEIDRLKQMIIAGLSYKEIGEKLGRSIKSINHAKEKYCPELITEYKKVYYIPQ